MKRGQIAELVAELERGRNSPGPRFTLHLCVFTASEMAIVKTESSYCKVYVGESPVTNSTHSVMSSIFRGDTQSTQLPDHKLYTKVAQATQHSAVVWNDNFDIDLDSAETQVLSILVRKQLPMFNASIGTCAIYLKQFRIGEPVDHMFALYKGNLVVGKIRLQILIEDKGDHISQQPSGCEKEGAALTASNVKQLDRLTSQPIAGDDSASDTVSRLSGMEGKRVQMERSKRSSGSSGHRSLSRSVTFDDDVRSDAPGSFDDTEYDSDKEHEMTQLKLKREMEKLRLETELMRMKVQLEEEKRRYERLSSTLKVEDLESDARVDDALPRGSMSRRPSQLLSVNSNSFSGSSFSSSPVENTIDLVEHGRSQTSTSRDPKTSDSARPKHARGKARRTKPAPPSSLSPAVVSESESNRGSRSGSDSEGVDEEDVKPAWPVDPHQLEEVQSLQDSIGLAKRTPSRGSSGSSKSNVNAAPQVIQLELSDDDEPTFEF